MHCSINSCLISVVITAYNSADTIARCLYSLINQISKKKIQIVVIDDSSTDNTVSLCVDILKSSEIDYIISSNKQNRGVGFSRQQGIEKCAGDYVLFLDSDDYVENDIIDSLYQAIKENENTEIIIFDYFMTYGEKNISVKSNYANKLDLAKQIISGQVYGFLWNKLIKKELFNNILFIPGVNMWEDVLVTAQIAKKAKEILYIEKSFIHYVQLLNSNVHKSISLNTIQSMILTINELKEKFYEEQYQCAIDYRIIEFYITLYLRADYKTYIRFINTFQYNKRNIFKLEQFNFLLKILFYFYNKFPVKFVYYFTRGSYKVLQKIKFLIRGL